VVAPFGDVRRETVACFGADAHPMHQEVVALVEDMVVALVEDMVVALVEDMVVVGIVPVEGDTLQDTVRVFHFGHGSFWDLLIDERKIFSFFLNCGLVNATSCNKGDVLGNNTSSRHIKVLCSSFHTNEVISRPSCRRFFDGSG